jgi:hypothetical protein
MGTGALGSTTTGSANVGIGQAALNNNTTSSNNTAVGGDALAANTTGLNNTAVGHNALTANTTANDNTSLGKNTATSLTTGSSNVFVGTNAGTYAVAQTTGSGNVILGPYSRCSTVGGNFANVIGYDVNGAAAYTTIGYSTSAIRTAHGSTAWAVVSDERVKKDITDATAGLSFINDLKPKTFKYKNLGEIPSEFKGYKEGSTEVYKNANTNHGFIAQEVKAAIDNHPEIKNGFAMWDVVEETGQQEVAETALIPMLVKAIQELSAEVEELKSQIGV